MSELVLPVDVHDAFDHLMLVGLASILEDSWHETCLLRWRDFRSAEISADRAFTPDDVAQVVSDHAKRWAQSPWLRAKGNYTADNKESSIHATLSPRLSGLSESGGWSKLQRDRHEVIDALQTVGDRRYVGALGEPSYWSGRGSNKQLQSDSGASRWEMVTRNKGQEFVGGRLLPLSHVVADFSVDRIRDGLLGNLTKDELNSDKSDSRTATGLHRPQATDNARAWCALMGVAAFPHMVTTSTKNRDATAGLMQMAGKRRFAVLPVCDSPWTLSKYRSVVRSAAMVRAGTELVDRGVLLSGHTEEGISISNGWLKEKGVVACVVFKQYMSDNASAPERWLERGQLYSVS
ncbi:hypothetical protein [Bifidobacterium eulemuris]|uniref:CRISPR-associated protein Csb3 n=1 Tax=Bifidobacterium eulemuris TaxID=1765219 RepID=A0A261G0U2_9BIFI|nr:hypothetical protein [Bifidobacterium eulemuris]OZG65049.1 hypothetical protein BEUL_2059 [Bifidobacterium eulemuris]QOL32866.1 hypothetical protein BE0216_10780 [Bifidobacterium eulemuris]